MYEKNLILLACCSLSFAAAAQAVRRDARGLIKAAIEAQGGEAKLRAIQNVRIEALGIRSELEQSERPEGPYVTEYQTISEIHDHANHRVRRTAQIQVPPLYDTSSAWVVNRDAVARETPNGFAAGPRSLEGEADEMLAFAPERILLTALATGDLHNEPGATVGSVAQDVVGFRYNGAAVRIFLNSDTHLPSMVETSGALAHNGFWRYLGDVKMQTRWTLWWLAKGGVRYPMQWNIERNGLPDAMMSIRSLALNESLDEKTLAIPAAVAEKYRAQPPAADLESFALPVANAVEIAQGVVQIPGNWNVAMVEQEAGVFIVEAPISSGYSAKVIAEAERRFPAKTILGVITTSDSWPHLAGIREYAARGIPIYALARNRPILELVLRDPRVSKPDALSRKPRAAIFHWVSAKTIVGAGGNRIELDPSAGATTERQMLAYFPGHRLLYGSDAFSKQQSGEYFLPQQVTEVMDAVKRNGLAVDRFFMMHMGVTDWKELAPAIEKAITLPAGGTN